MSGTPETDEIGLLLDTLDELITESIPISKPIGLTLCDASRTISSQRDRITELWSALELVRRERDEAMSKLKRLKKELAAANKGAERNAKINQSLCAKLQEAYRDQDEAVRDLAGAEELHSRRFSTMKGEFNEAMKQRDEARFERDEFAAALRRIAGMYSVEKSTFQLACVAYEMSCVAKAALNQEDEE